MSPMSSKAAKAWLYIINESSISIPDWDDTSNGPRTIKSFIEKNPDFFKRASTLKDTSFKLSIEKELSEL